MLVAGIFFALVALFALIATLLTMSLDKHWIE